MKFVIEIDIVHICLDEHFLYSSNLTSFKAANPAMLHTVSLTLAQDQVLLNLRTEDLAMSQSQFKAIGMHPTQQLLLA